MRFYLAPLEGVTGYIYRNAYEAFYGAGKIDKYFIPFISPNKTNGFTARETADIMPEHNTGLKVAVQIMANNTDFFIDTVNMLYEKGYEEVNLNLGCPSGTVVSKYRGAGFLALPDQLEDFLEKAFNSPLIAAGKVKMSVKTRLGIEKPEEFYPLLEMYNRYPLEELIIHPRVQKDYYKNTPNWEVFKKALDTSTNPVCYNGDIFTLSNFEKFCAAFPSADCVMLGRGLIADPALINALTAKANGDCVSRDLMAEKNTLKAFHNQIYKEYLKIMSGDKNAIHKMKEIWFYQKQTFENGDKLYKKIRKSQKMADYESAVAEFFTAGKLIEQKNIFFN